MIINENYTGVYSYYQGEYLDGSGWTPPSDYEPTERPWYRAAVEAGGKITTVKPYLNLQTRTMMMSVCQMLDDGKSVVSMDIFLDSGHNGGINYRVNSQNIAEKYYFSFQPTVYRLTIRQFG